MTVRTFIKECHKREVFKKLSLYIVFSWVVIQVLVATWDPLGLPKSSVVYLILVLLIGLPLYAFYIGRFEIKDLKEASLEDGIETPEELSNIATFKRFFYVGVTFISALVAVAAFFIMSNSLKGNTRQVAVNVSDKIAVLEFDNNTDDDKYDVLSEMAADWIIQGITENEIGQVVSPGIIDSYANNFTSGVDNTSNKNVLYDVIKPSTIISGNFYLQANKLLFKGAIIDGGTQEFLVSFDAISCDESSPLVCIENLQQRILGYFVTEDKAALNLQQKPPKFKAYQDMIEAKTSHSSGSQEYLNLITNAIEEDPDFFEPKVLQVAYYYNSGNFKIADSLLNLVKPLARNSSRQRNLLKMYAALLQGENKQIYNYLLEEYKVAPFDLASNSGAMVVAMQFVNKPEDVPAIFEQISMEQLDLNSCLDCQSRILMKATALLSQQKYLEVLQLPYEKRYYEYPYLSALIHLDSIETVENYLEQKTLRTNLKETEGAYFFAASQLLITDSITAIPFLKKTQEINSQLRRKAKIAYFLGDFTTAQRELETAIKLYPEDVGVLSLLAILTHKAGEVSRTNQILERLESLRGPYQFGSIDYAKAQYYAGIGNESAMYQNLIRSVASGNFYTLQSYQNDPFFKKYKDSPQFESILNFWH